MDVEVKQGHTGHNATRDACRCEIQFNAYNLKSERWRKGEVNILQVKSIQLQRPPFKGNPNDCNVKYVSVQEPAAMIRAASLGLCWSSAFPISWVWRSWAEVEAAVEARLGRDGKFLRQLWLAR